MTLFIIQMQYHLRKRMILHLLMLFILVSVLTILLSIADKDILRVELSRLSLQMIAIFLPFLVLFIAMDHHAPYLRPCDAYFGRSRMFFSKWLAAVFVFTYAWIIIFLIEQSMLTLWTGQLFEHHELHAFLWMHLDGILLITICQMLIKDRHKTLSLLIPVVWIVLIMILDDNKLDWIHYLFPIQSSMGGQSSLAYPYKLCYSFLVMMLAHQKSVWETI
jgi:hypothetical protein